MEDAEAQCQELKDSVIPASQMTQKHSYML